jgi:DNA helicase-2/ATP-dependent DNA helicase PcrA
MWVMTFHSACVRILRREIDKLGLKSNFSIYDAADSKRLMALVLRDLDLDPKRYQPAAVLHWVSNLKNELRRPETYAAKDEGNSPGGYAQAYAAYQRRLRQANALDFDDLIMTTVHLLQRSRMSRSTTAGASGMCWSTNTRTPTTRSTPDPRAGLRGLHAGQGARGDRRDGIPLRPASELVVVGDADQSIYAFRGATIRNILEFEQDFPDAPRTILLEQNYRSTQTILRRGQRGHRPQPRPAPQEPVDRSGDGASDRRLRRRQRARRGALRRARSTARRRARGQTQGRRGLLPHQRAVACVRGGVRPGRSCPTRWSAAPASTSARRSRTRWPTCG